MFGLGVLSLLIAVPFLGAVALALYPARRAKDAKNVGFFAFLISLATFLLSLSVYTNFDVSASGFQFLEEKFWLDEIIAYRVGVDGVSLVFVLLTTFLVCLSLLASLQSVKEQKKLYFIVFLLLESLMIGVFISLDLVLFYLFFESVLLPMFLLIGIWGGAGRVYASFKLFLYTLFGSLLMLLAIIAIYHAAGTMDVRALLTYEFSSELQYWLWLAFFASFAIKTPMWPVHTWLPDAHVEAPTAGSVILAGVLLKMGGYGFLRFSLPMFPEASAYFANFVFILSGVAIIYASLVALAQTDVKKLVAYSSIAHMGYVTAGLFSLNEAGIQGAIFQMISHGLISSALFFSVGVLYDRLHTREISAYAGLVNHVPIFGVFFVILTMANVALPGTSGFIGEFLVLLGLYEANIFAAIIATTGVILSASYGLFLTARIIFGAPAISTAPIPEINWREFLVLFLLTALTIYYGVQPQGVLDMTAPYVAQILK